MKDFINAVLVGYTVNWHMRNQARQVFYQELDKRDQEGKRTNLASTREKYRLK